MSKAEQAAWALVFAGMWLAVGGVVYAMTVSIPATQDSNIRNIISVMVQANEAGWDCRDRGESREACAAALRTRLFRSAE